MGEFSHYYLIDFENVGVKGLCGLLLPDASSEIKVFLSQNAHLGTKEIRKDMLAARAKIDTLFCSMQGKNAMDFEIAAYFGKVLEQPATERISIISRDNGFLALTDYGKKIRSRVKVYLGESILEAYIAARAGYQKKQYEYDKKNTVDFKHIIRDLRKQEQFAVPVRGMLAGYSEDVIEEVIKRAGDDHLRPRELYLGLLKILGRRKGLAIYRMIRDLRQG